MIKIDTKRRYIHIERTDGCLYIYSDNNRWGHRVVTLQEMDEECLMSGSDNFKLAIRLEDFIGVVK